MSRKEVFVSGACSCFIQAAQRQASGIVLGERVFLRDRPGAPKPLPLHLYLDLFRFCHSNLQTPPRPRLDFYEGLCLIWGQQQRWRNLEHPHGNGLMNDVRHSRVSLSSAQRRVVADLLPELIDRLQLDQKNPRTISFTAEELESIQSKAAAAWPHIQSGMVRNSMVRVVDAVAKALDDSQGIGAIPVSRRLYQFKIALLQFQPVVWRRIQVKDSTLDKLHEQIQTAMGWTNSHLHEFEIDGVQFGDPELLRDGFGDGPLIDSTVTKVSEIVPQDGKRFRFHYTYDFGDGWKHEVLFEGCLKSEKGGRYPVCVEGERKCPPEDVGGVWGFAEFLKAIADPDHEEHVAMLRWAGEFDPEDFDAAKTTKAMRRGLPNWRQYG